MIVETLLKQLFTVLGYLLPFFVLIFILNSAWFKGIIGEFQINLILKMRLPADKYKLIKNVTLATDDGTTQIDHILVCPYGVFVIETKNMKGWIFGAENQKLWTQKIFKYSIRFQNPLHQNYKHTKTLQKYLDIEPNTIFSIVVFIGDSQFKTKMPDNVTYGGGCVGYIKSKNERLLSDAQVTRVVSSIKSGQLARGIKTNREHVAHVRKIVEEKSSIMQCEKCGSEMLLRTASKGKNKGSKFLGCASFPQCKNIKAIS